MYKTIDELSTEQFDELRDRTNSEQIDNGEDELTDEQIREKFAGTQFTDDDFFCSVRDDFGESVNGIEAVCY